MDINVTGSGTGDRTYRNRSDHHVDVPQHVSVFGIRDQLRTVANDDGAIGAIKVLQNDIAFLGVERLIAGHTQDACASQ